MITALFVAGLAVGLIRYAIKHQAPAPSTTRTCGTCGLSVTGPRLYPRCPSCGAGLDVKKVA